MKYFTHGFLLIGLMLASQAQAQSMAEMGEVMEAQTAAAPAVPVPPTPGAMTVPANPPVQPSQPASAGVPSASKQESPRESLFFSNNQLVAIMRANQGFIAPKEAVDKTNQSERPVDPGPRVLNLSGIVYHGANDWTIWFNGTRITPKNIPERILKLNVSNDRIQFKWFDIGGQRIINLTLYPHQQYNIDTNTILPSS